MAFFSLSLNALNYCYSVIFCCYGLGTVAVASNKMLCPAASGYIFSACRFVIPWYPWPLVVTHYNCFLLRIFESLALPLNNTCGLFSTSFRVTITLFFKYLNLSHLLMSLPPPHFLPSPLPEVFGRCSP